MKRIVVALAVLAVVGLLALPSAADAPQTGPVPAGTYAVACFHDANKNGKLDTGIFGIPQEGACASNGATGTFGPPSFRDARFDISGAARDVPVRMKY